MKKTRARRALPLFALVVAFAAGIAVDAGLRVYGPPLPAAMKSDVWLPSSSPPTAGQVRLKPDATANNSQVRLKPDTTADNNQVRLKPNTTTAAVSDFSRTSGTTGSASSAPLLVPIEGVSADSFRGGFAEKRGKRPHEAVDILAPRGTPIHAAQDGTIAKLFASKPGGTTIYEFDPAQRLCFYYAHLERYADGLHEGQHVSRGEVIGFVGTSGNAPPNTPHLHFAVFELNADHHWWQGTALDPYLLYRTNS
jgi:murein DD-endopeptidase MepM/ murein hydrolase activator NlpD